VVEPDQIVDPYDKTLKDAGRGERHESSTAMLADLDGRSARSDRTHLRSTPGLTIERGVGVSMPRAPRQRRAA
jgi:hypothetical protein